MNNIHIVLEIQDAEALIDKETELLQDLLNNADLDAPDLDSSVFFTFKEEKAAWLDDDDVFHDKV